MTAAAFDTLKFVRRLRGDETFTPQQAERLADAMSEAVYPELATKSDLSAEIGGLRTELKADIAGLRAEMKADIGELRTGLTAEFKNDTGRLRTELADLRTELADTKSEILKWMFGAVGLQTLVLLGALIALMRTAHP